MKPSAPVERVRLTISLAGDIAREVDNLVDGVRIRNRSHAVESLIIESLHLAQIRQAVVLAGGDHANKRLPAIKEMLRKLQAGGIFEAWIAVGYMGDMVKTELGEGEAYGMRFHYVESELGTGGALLQMKGRLKQTFIVVNVSKPLEVDINNLLRFHREHRPFVTIATPSIRDLSGIYVMEPKALATIPSGFCMLEDTVLPELSEQGKLLSFPILKST